ncbi:hypothetical protein HD554DRAFT_2314600 [Boletus coccyginus]|nr:hypothetical protein HD554DRAFT_2314600 [Boletus coccyginus]
MLPAKKRQRTKRGPKKRPVSSSTPGSSSLLDAFFADYSPQFQYDATASSSLEFYRLCDESGWDRDDPERKEAHQKFKDALVRQFNFAYGTDVNSLANWQNLCHVVRIDPVPDGLHACREAVYYSFVNLVDLVDTKNTGVDVRVFNSERELSDYTKSTGKFFPRDSAYAGGLLRYLLRHIYHPRDGYARPGAAGIAKGGFRSRPYLG